METLLIPATYDLARTVTDKVIFALACVGSGTADEVVRRIEELEPDADQQPVIGTTHPILTELYQQAKIAGHERDGNLVYELHST